MTPLAFTLQNAIEIIPDWRRRQITEDARKCVETGAEYVKPTAIGTYWDGVVAAHEQLLWQDAYDRRKARLERLAKK